MTKITAAAVLLLMAAFLMLSAARATRDLEAELKTSSKSKKNKGSGGGGGAATGGGGAGIPGFGTDPGSFFGPGGQFNFPGMGGANNWGGGYGAGYGGPDGGYAKGGVVRPSVICSDHGPCYKKKLTCPEKCFTSYAHSGKNYGVGGGGGGCTMDCKKHCVAYC